MGVQSAGGGRSANFARRALAEEKGGIFWQPLRGSLLLFSSKLFQTGRSAFCSGTGWGYKAPGESAARILPVALWQRKGGNFAAAACQLAAFSSKFFQTGRSAFLLKIDLGALSRVGEFNVV